MIKREYKLRWRTEVRITLGRRGQIRKDKTPTKGIGPMI
jgi:hypothetical protein